jgi:exodeoxyribonuclease VIII
MTTNRPMGLIKDLSFDEYHAVDALSASGMRELSRSAWHYRNRVPITPTRAMLNGSLVHCAQLEPGALSSRYVVVPEDAPKRPTKAQWNAAKPSPASVEAMNWWTGFQKTCGEREIVAADDYATTQAQLKALQADPLLKALFSSGYGEASVFWIDRVTGVYCKARPDWVHPVTDRRVRLLDLKAMADDTPEGFSRGVARMGYHRQQAHYTAGFEAATGLTVEDFVFAVVSSVPPVLAVPYRLIPEVLEQADQECAELRSLYAHCTEHNRWPAYTAEEMMIDLPKWAKRSQELEVSYVSEGEKS